MEIRGREKGLLFFFPQGNPLFIPSPSTNGSLRPDQYMEKHGHRHTCVPDRQGATLSLGAQWLRWLCTWTSSTLLTAWVVWAQPFTTGQDHQTQGMLWIRPSMRSCSCQCWKAEAHSAGPTQSALLRSFQQGPMFLKCIRGLLAVKLRKFPCLLLIWIHDFSLWTTASSCLPHYTVIIINDNLPFNNPQWKSTENCLLY